MAAGDLSARDRAELDKAIRSAEQSCRFEFSVFIGAAEGDPRAYSQRLHASLVAPTHLGGVQRAWMAFGLALSKITSPIFMSIVYIGVITPIGILRRNIGRDPLVPVSGPDRSVWVERQPNPPKKMERLF